MYSMHKTETLTKRLESIKRVITRLLRNDFRKTALSLELRDHPNSLQKLATRIFCWKKTYPNKHLVCQESSFSNTTKDSDTSQQLTKAALFRSYLVAILQEDVSHSLAVRGLDVCEQIIDDECGPSSCNYTRNNADNHDKNRQLMTSTKIFYIYFAVCVMQNNLEDRSRLHKFLRIISYESDSIALDGSSFYKKAFRKIRRIAFRILVEVSCSYDHFCLSMQILSKSSVLTEHQLVVLKESLNADDAFDSIDASDAHSFSEYADASIPAHMKLDWSWSSFGKWDLAYLFANAGHEFVDLKTQFHTTHRCQLHEFISTVEDPISERHLSETFSDIPYLYKDCLPRPFPTLDNIWAKSRESVSILWRDELVTDVESMSNHLIVQIFGFAIVSVEFIDYFEESSNQTIQKVCVLAPEEAVLVPSSCSFLIRAVTSCCQKIYSWDIDYADKEWTGPMPRWVTLSDELHAQRKAGYRYGKSKSQYIRKSHVKHNSGLNFDTRHNQMNGKTQDKYGSQTDPERVIDAQDDPGKSEFSRSPGTNSPKSKLSPGKSQAKEMQLPFDEESECNGSRYCLQYPHTFDTTETKRCSVKSLGEQYYPINQMDEGYGDSLLEKSTLPAPKPKSPKEADLIRMSKKSGKIRKFSCANSQKIRRLKIRRSKKRYERNTLHKRPRRRFTMKGLLKSNGKWKRVRFNCFGQSAALEVSGSEMRKYWCGESRVENPKLLLRKRSIVDRIDALSGNKRRRLV